MVELILNLTEASSAVRPGGFKNIILENDNRRNVSYIPEDLRNIEKEFKSIYQNQNPKKSKLFSTNVDFMVQVTL